MVIPQQDRKVLSARIYPVLETVHDWRHKPQEGLTKARAVARVLNHQHWNLVEGPSCHTLKPARSDDRPRGLKKVDLLQPSLSGSKPKPHGWRQTQKKRGRKELLVINSDEGYEGLIDGDVVSFTRKRQKSPRLREIGPRTLFVLDGAEQHSLKQQSALKRSELQNGSNRKFGVFTGLGNVG